MKIDHTRIIAEMRANVCGRASSVVQHVGMACVLACTCVALTAPVQAQDRGGFRKDDLQQQQPRDDRTERNPQRQESTRFEPRDARDARAEEMRRQQDHNAQQRQSGRLTADERRDLRRQINEAGVDLYPNTPRR